ncbi:MAG: uL15 family ribosomal protein [Candidatus Baldrarchaeia archaeon]
MVVRRRKKSRKMRGSRTHGYGRVGQHRGAGQRGGRGKSGRHKHLWTYIVKYEPDYFGKHGFTRYFRLVKELSAINVGELDEIAERLAKEGKAEFKDDKIVIDVTKLGYEKVLGKGKVTRPLIVKAIEFSEKAAEKIINAGGEVIKIGETSEGS